MPTNISPCTSHRYFQINTFKTEVIFSSKQVSLPLVFSPWKNYLITQARSLRVPVGPFLSLFSILSHWILSILSEKSQNLSCVSFSSSSPLLPEGMHVLTTSWANYGNLRLIFLPPVVHLPPTHHPTSPFLSLSEIFRKHISCDVWPPLCSYELIWKIWVFCYNWDNHK